MNETCFSTSTRTLVAKWISWYGTSLSCIRERREGEWMGKMGKKCAARKFIHMCASLIHPLVYSVIHLFSPKMNCTNNTLWPEFISTAAHKCNFQRKYFARSWPVRAMQEHHPFHYFNYRSRKTIRLSLVWQRLVYDCISESCMLQSSTSSSPPSTACIEIGVVLWLVACNSIKLYDYCYIISVCIGKLESIFRSPLRPFAWSFRAIFFAADFVVRFAFRRQSARPLISILWVRYSNRTQSPLSISRLINQNGWLAGIGLP